MPNIDLKIKQWIELIQTEKLDNITEEIQMNAFIINEKENKYIFKLLLYLSHTADKCNKQNYATGKEIYKLTCLLCSILTNIPDDVKFVSSLFHIIRCLLTMYMYNEAYELCFYLKTEALNCSQKNVYDILVKIAYLWHNAISNEFLILQKDSSGSTHYYQLKNVIQYEFETIKIVYKNYAKQLLMKICSYLDKIALINKEPNCFTDFSAFIIEYLNQTSILLNEDEKYVICRHVFHITSRIMCENIKEKYLKSSINVLNTVSRYFTKILLKDEECYQCFVLFEQLCFIFAKPVEYLAESNPGSIQELSKSYKKLTKKYGYLGSIKWITFSIVQILESLFIYWETCIRTGKKMYLKCDTLLEIMNLVGHISICFLKQTSEKCKSCKSEDCLIRKDIYNAVVIKTRYINLISKFSKTDLSKDIFVYVRKILEENVSLIYEMKEHKCKYWTQLWCTSSTLIYNFSIMCDSFYEESVFLFTLLFTSIIQFEGIQSKSPYINLQNPICFTLHRLGSLHYSHGMYREAMTATALNALLSYNDLECKAFRMWANIKVKSVFCKEIMEMSIVACLKRDKLKIEELGITIDLSKYDLIEICLKEAKVLQEAKVNLSNAIHNILIDMKVLKATIVAEARVVQMLAYHSLNFDSDDDNVECINETIFNLKQVKQNKYILCLQANLEFYIFVSQLNTLNKKMQMEMENTKFALHAPKVDEDGEADSRDVVPAYNMINIKEDSRLMMYLQLPVQKWKQCLEKNAKEIAEGYDSLITLHTMIIAGEYAHFYRYEECEVNIWKLIYALASELQESSAIIYVTARTIALRHINYDWITSAESLAITLKNNNDKDVIYAIAVFWISLSDFYFECDKYNEAKELLDKSRKLSGISFFSNIAVYLYSLDRILYNCHLYNETIKHEEYTKYIVETLYTMVNLNEELSTRKWKPQDKYLFDLDILLSATINLSLRMNSLLSFREIGAHLVRRLRTAQSLGATIRVAEILKSLCYIDLSRMQLNDCEIKLQGLEHILHIETFKASMDSNCTKGCSENVGMTPIQSMSSTNDISQNDTSPILRRKVFHLPESFCHQNCYCYMCQNLSYRYLVFASTHIRAQLYALRKDITTALQHFHGAFKIKEILIKTKASVIKHKDEYLSWQERFYTIDYILSLLHFSNFLKNYLSIQRGKIFSIVLLAVKMCNEYKLNGHPIYMAVTELMLDYRFQEIYNFSDHAKLIVPDISEINVSKYIQESKVEGSICVTPTINNTRTKKPITLRRNRTPPLLKLTKVSMNFSDDEDDSSLPTECKKINSHGKLTRRKILDEEYADTNTKQEQNQCKNNLSFENFNQIEKNNLNKLSMRDIINKISAVAPDISEHLCRIIGKLDEPATTNTVKKLIDTIKGIKINTVSQRNVRTRYTKAQTSNDSIKINEVIALFKDFVVDEEQDNCNHSNKNDVVFESLSPVRKDSLLSQQQNEVIDTSKIQKFEQSQFFINQYNEGDVTKKPTVNASTRLRNTRNSAKHSVINAESHGIKQRKSKKKLK